MPVAIKTFAIDLAAAALWTVECRFTITSGGKALTSTELAKLQVKAEMWDLLHTSKLYTSPTVTAPGPAILDGGIAGAWLGVIPTVVFVKGFVLDKATGKTLGSAESMLTFYDGTYSDPDLAKVRLLCKSCNAPLAMSARPVCSRCGSVHRLKVVGR